MKITNLHDTQYLIYYLKRSKQTVDDYETFINNLSNIIDVDSITFIDKIHQTQHINIRPYLFTIYTNTPDAFKCFIKYVYHYLKKAEYSSNDLELLNMYDNIENSSTHIFLDLLKHSNLMLVTLLFLMQYYFL